MNKSQPQGLSVLMPVYNEERTVAEILAKVLRLPVVLKEVLVVDDGSRDRSAAIVERIASEDRRVRLVRLDRNRGRRGHRPRLQEATGELIIIQDADLSTIRREIPELIAPIVEGKADVVYGSRFMVPCRACRVLYFYHYLANRFLTPSSPTC